MLDIVACCKPNRFINQIETLIKVGAVSLHSDVKLDRDSKSYPHWPGAVNQNSDLIETTKARSFFHYAVK